jgi:catechol 2,3-dioxygenase-like lactoylglutathione lyase family enzyme
VFKSLDFIYTPTSDVDAAAAFYVGHLGGRLDFKINGMGTTVARVDVSPDGPAILLTGHLTGERPILVYRVDDYAAATAELRAAGVDLHELEIPHGPCASFVATGDQRLAIYELVRPDANSHFSGRFDP